MDIGTGDGRFVLEAAGRDADVLFVGLDAAANPMAEASRKAARQKLHNVLFVQAAVEKLPPALSGMADSISVNFPWGSLLRAVTVPDIRTLAAIAGLARHNATLTMLVNMSVFDDAGYCARLGLPVQPVFADAGRTCAAYSRAGFTVKSIAGNVRDLPYKTTWGQKLTRGTRRRVLRLDAVYVGDAAARNQVGA